MDQYDFYDIFIDETQNNFTCCGFTVWRQQHSEIKKIPKLLSNQNNVQKDKFKEIKECLPTNEISQPGQTIQPVISLKKKPNIKNLVQKNSSRSTNQSNQIQDSIVNHKKNSLICNQKQTPKCFSPCCFIDQAPFRNSDNLRQSNVSISKFYNPHSNSMPEKQLDQAYLARIANKNQILDSHQPKNGFKQIKKVFSVYDELSEQESDHDSYVEWRAPNTKNLRYINNPQNYKKIRSPSGFQYRMI